MGFFQSKKDKFFFMLMICLILSAVFLKTQVKSKASDSGFSVRDGMCSMTDSSINRMESDHFQIIWGNSNSSVTTELVKGNLTNLENIRTFYTTELGMKDTSVSAWKDTTTKYKTNLYIAGTGLSGVDDGWAYMSTDKDGYGYMVTMPEAMRVDEPSWVIPHEYAHVMVYHQLGVVPGEWAEALANWFRDQYLGSSYYKYGDNVYGPASDFFAPLVTRSDYYIPHIYNYYDAWPVFLYVTENPDNLDGLGLTTMRNAIWDKTENESNMIDRIARLSGISTKDILGYYARRMVTMDFSRQSCYMKYLTDLLADSSKYDSIYTTLKEDNGWLCVPDEKAPMQSGYNIIPLNVDLSQKQVVVNFESTSTYSDADFRVSLVSKTANNKTRYSKLFSNGSNSMALNGDEEKVYLVVCATPDKLQKLDTYNENAVGNRYTYRIKVSTSDTASSDSDTDGSSSDNSNTDTSESNNTTETVSPDVLSTVSPVVDNDNSASPVTLSPENVPGSDVILPTQTPDVSNDISPATSDSSSLEWLMICFGMSGIGAVIYRNLIRKQQQTKHF